MSTTRVPVGACRCPGSPHQEGDWVDLRDEATIDIGAAIYAAVASVGDNAPLMQVEMTRAYLRYGIAAWSFVDAKGQPIPIRPRDPDFFDEVIAVLLPLGNGGFEVADKADALYTATTLRPLMTRQSSTRSPGGQTGGSTSPTRASLPKRRTRSGSSSRRSTGGKPSEGQGP